MITWTITSMESQPDTGIVVSASWLCTDEYNGHTVSLSGTCMFPSPEGGYTPYQNLNQDQVLNWCWTDGGLDKAITEASIMSAMQQVVSPVVIEQPLPWTA